MIAYVDASALVKLYIQEWGTEDVLEILDGWEVCGTSSISRVEVSSAIARAARARLLTLEAMHAALKSFARDWQSMVRMDVSDTVIERGADLAVKYRLRGYNALHLSAALTWRDLMGEDVTMATFDRELWEGAVETGLPVWPDRLIGKKA